MRFLNEVRRRQRFSPVLLGVVLLTLCWGGAQGANNPNLPDFYAGDGLPPIRDYMDLGSNVVVDPFGGKLKIVQTDLSVAGAGDFRIDVIRSYTSRDRNYGDDSAVGIGWKMHFGRVILPTALPSCGNARNGTAGDNPVFEMPDGRRVLFREPGQPASVFGLSSFPAFFFVSEDRWIASCAYKNSSPVYIVKSPAGTVYTLAKVVSPGNLASSLYVTKVADRNGNNAVFSYLGDNDAFSPFNTRALITRITLSDSQSIYFNYADATAARAAHTRLQSVSYQGHTWNYVQTRHLNTSRYFLDFVKRPDDARWTYRYEKNSSDSGFLSINRVTDPYGRVTAIMYAQQSFVSSTGVDADSVVNKVTVSADAPSVPEGVWTYDYRPGFEAYTNGTLDRTIVEGPTSTMVYDHYGYHALSTGPTDIRGDAWRMGLIAGRYTCGPGAGTSCGPYGSTGSCIGGCNNGGVGLVEQTVYEWEPEDIAYDSATLPLGLADTIGEVARLKAVVVKRDGTSYRTDYSSFDNYGNARTVTESGQLTRRTDRTFYLNKSKWIVNAVDKETVFDVEGQNAVIDRVFDSSGNVDSVDKYGAVTRFDYDSRGQPLWEEDANRNRTTYSLYKRGKPQRTTRPEGVVERQVVNDDGTTFSVTDGNGNTTIFGYDGLFRIQSINYPEGADSVIDWAIGSNALTNVVFTRDTYRETREFNVLGHVDRRIRQDMFSGETITETFRYDADGRVVFRSLPNSSDGVVFTYDALGRLKKTTNADLTSVNYRYLSGNRVEINNERGVRTTLTYRSFGNPDEKALVNVAAAEGITTVIQRDKLDNIRSIAQGGTTRIFGYNTRFQLNKVFDPEVGEVILEPDAVGNVRFRTVASMGTTEYRFDGLNRLERTIFSEAGVPDIVRIYDRNSNIRSVTHGDIVRSYGYNKNDQLDDEHLSISLPGDEQVRFDLDYVLDPLDNVARMVYPSGREVDYDPDAFGRSTMAEPYVTYADHYPSGQPKSITFANGVSTTYGQWADRLWLKGMRAADRNNVAITDLQYGYDEVGNMDRIRDLKQGPGYDWLLDYDGVDRLQKAEGLWGLLEYAYDATGNITHRTLNGNPSQYQYDPATNRLNHIVGAAPVTYRYDGYGNVSERNGDSYAYNEAGHMVAALGAADLAMAYDGDGTLVVRTEGGETEYLFYDKQGHLRAEKDAAGNLQKETIYLGGRPVASVAVTNQWPVLTITSPGDGARFAAGEPVALSANASDPEAGDLSGLIVWQSDRDGVLGSGAQVTTSTLSVGTHMITASVDDGQGGTDQKTLTLTIAATNSGGGIDFNSYSLVPVPGQDLSGGATVEDGGRTLRLFGNTWKRIAYPYVVTASTVIEFDYRRDQLGEVHGIGFDNGGTPPDMALTTFALEGTQKWGIRSYRYSGTGDWVRFRIPVGQHYTGSFSNLVFVMDDDANAAGDERFRSLVVYDDGAGKTPTAINFSSHSLVPVPEQDLSGGATVEDGGSTLHLVGNTWKRIAYPYVVTASTVIEFDYRSDQVGEVHGIGFDNGGGPPDMAQTTFVLEGTQVWGIRSYSYPGMAGWVRVRIPVGQHYTGSFSNLVFVMDDDANRSGDERFRNLSVYEQ